ncbi:hypothetical protein BCV69DRAFT_251150 [Microstroma glucosiphilum]|uniref:Uncharacterized protein n=1 Tax=Pseudomicrostroma glucosiphilum TaxID=1684307 RepID=A0A316U2E7_9BASI|nr:hypothetical protein BCV69DRAFT_251150 [Pseudomicrostroma glucosiphilum]PWN19509.1 hypothetical protein BCV69DRAFT_251150 [Pseudomicrostroma glucosiphilum]
MEVEERAVAPNRLEAVRILKAAAAAVTPNYGTGGHKARRSVGEHHRRVRYHPRDLAEDGEQGGLEERAATPNELEAVRILKAAAAAVTPDYGRGGHQARDEPAESASTELPAKPKKKKKRSAGTCAKKNSSSTSTSVVTSSTSKKSTSTTTTTSTKATSTSKASSSKATSTTATNSTKTATTTTASSTATATCGSSSYGYTQARADLNKIMKWAYVTDIQTEAQKVETTYAVLSAANRYYPELATQDAVRYLLADINAESSFNVTSYSGGRLDSGASLGLLQVSPGSGSQLLPLFVGHARVSYNNYSWSDTVGPCGALLDYATGKQLSLAGLTTDDLYRPWVNIHVAAWVQSNLARTSSADPYDWEQTSDDAYTFIAAQAKYNAAVAAGTSSSSLLTAMNKANKTLTADLVGAGLPRSLLTGAGSWVAGPATDGDGSYTSADDDVSAPYFANIEDGLAALYGDKTHDSDWLDSQVLTAGLVDYRPSS